MRQRLAALQRAFGDGVSTPLEFGPDGPQLQVDQYELDLMRQMVSSGELSGPERFATYNRQYWFRLFGVMQDEYPLLVKLLGLERFNPMVSDYLSVHPSTSPTLRDLSEHLVEYLEGRSAWSRPEWIQCARLEWLFIHAFDAEQRPALQVEGLSLDDQEALLSQPLELQPHWALFSEDWDLVQSRRRVRANGDVEIELNAQVGRWAVYRSETGVAAVPLTTAQWVLLQRLARGETLASSVEGAAGELDTAGRAELTAGVQVWFTRWRSWGWFAQRQVPG